MDFTEYDLSGLHSTYIAFDEQCKFVSKQIEDLTEDVNSEKFQNLLVKFIWLSEMVETAQLEIQKRQTEKLLFSVEDMFRLVGQYDKYVVIKFYRTSDACKKYGNEVHGTIIYGIKLRNALTNAIAVENHERTDGKILFMISGDDVTKVHSLKTEGFLASEIYSISTFNDDPSVVTYKKEGKKEIPNTIMIPFESESFDLPRMENMITSWKFDGKTKILDHEMLRYCTNQIIIGEVVPDENKEKYLLNENKKFKEQVLVQLYGHGLHYDILDKQQRLIFNAILKTRGDRRIETLKKDLGITDKVFQNFQAQYPQEYKIVRSVLLSFHDDFIRTQY